MLATACRAPSSRPSQTWRTPEKPAGPRCCALTDGVRAILLPVDCGFAVLWRVLLGNGCGGCCCGRGCCGCCGGGCRGRLLLSQLLPEGLLPRLHHVRHHRVDQGEGLYGAAVEHRAVLRTESPVGGWGSAPTGGLLGRKRRCLGPRGGWDLDWEGVASTHAVLGR